jgi:hypothetical protein
VRETPQGLLVQIPPAGFDGNLFFFAVVWNVFLVFWYSIAIASGNWLMWLMAVFATGHLVVGLGLIGGILYMLLG